MPAPFRKLLIANRGEIAVRILRACRELGIPTVALYQAADRGSLHVRLADESVLLDSRQGYLDQEVITRIARARGADAIHPGYGFLAEREDFARQCQAASIAFIGPPPQVIEATRCKVDVLERARQAGFPTPAHSGREFEVAEMGALKAEADHLGYPLVVKSARGGRGRGERLVWSAERLEAAVRRAQAESQVIYGGRQVYLERAILPAHQIGVQVAGDGHGNLLHLGEREGSLLYGNQKILEEAPAPCLSQTQRQRLWSLALDLARLFDFQNVGTVEFLVDKDGHFYFTEIKPRIQIEHPLTEMLARVDLVAEQIRLAAGEPLSFCQEQVRLDGWAMECRIRAEDPWRQFLPSPGRLHQARWPAGPQVRVDTYLEPGCEIPADYDPLVAKLVVWGRDRPACIERLRFALQECQLAGTATNLPLVQRILEQPAFLQGDYDTDLLIDSLESLPDAENRFRDLAVAAAIAYIRQGQAFRPETPQRLSSGWHRQGRRLPG